MAKRRRNPSPWQAAAVVVGAGTLTGVVTYVVLREIFVAQVVEECTNNIEILQGTAPVPPKPQLERRVRTMI